MSEFKHFSDFAGEGDGLPLEGRKRRIDEIINIELLYINYRITPSKKNDGRCLTLQFEYEGEKQVIFTGSTVLTEQIERYKNELPFLAKIKKIGNYFTFS